MYRRLICLRSTLALWACITAACATEVESGTDPGAQTVQLPAALGGGPSVTAPAGSTGSAAQHHGVGAIYTPPPTSGDGPEPLAALPSSADLSSEAPPPGDQGDTGSCTTWSTAHSALGWWANHKGYTGATFAPMYLYAQIVKGSCATGSTVETVLAMIKQHGVDTQTDFEPMQFDLDCGTQPTSAQKTNAGRFKITYSTSNMAGGAQQAIESVIAAGRPAILSLEVYPEFDDANSSSYLVGPPRAGDVSRGGHAIAAFAYDSAGVWVMNSWGLDWGNNGWAELSWDFVNGSFNNGMANVFDVDSITGLDFDSSDDNSSCPLWAFTAQCQDNPSYMLSSCSLSCANPNPTFSSAASWFHIQNVALGSSYSLDTGVIAATGNYSGQDWELSPLGGGYYRLTNMFQGDGMSFDTSQMASTGNYSGQSWLLVPITNGVYRLTNDFLGPDTSLTVNTKTLALESDRTVEDPSQYWQISSAD